jgi:hypothetical protein
VAGEAVLTLGVEVVGRVALAAVLVDLGLDPHVKRVGVCGLVVTPCHGATLHRVSRRLLLMGVVARAAHLVVGLVVRHLHERAHGVAAQALAGRRREDPQQLTLGRGLQRGFGGDCLQRRVERVARGAVDHELAHLTELHLAVGVTVGLGAGLVEGGELVNGGSVALDAHEAFEHRVFGFEVDPVTSGAGNEVPLVRITLHVAIDAPFVGHRCVDGDLVRIEEDRGDAHGGPLEERRLMAGFAAQAPMCALCELLVRLLHEVASHAELVVVLDVVPGPVSPDGADDDRGEHSDHCQGEDWRGKPPQGLPSPGEELLHAAEHHRVLSPVPGFDEASSTSRPTARTPPPRP